MSNRHRRRFVTALAALMAVAALAPLPAHAQSLDALRASGAVGERYDGLLTVRDAGASSSARALVADVNAKRSAIYSKRAAEQGVGPDQVGRVYALEIFKNAPSGTWFQDESGGWRRK